MPTVQDAPAPVVKEAATVQTPPALSKAADAGERPTIPVGRMPMQRVRSPAALYVGAIPGAVGSAHSSAAATERRP